MNFTQVTCKRVVKWIHFHCKVFTQIRFSGTLYPFASLDRSRAYGDWTL